MTAPSIKVDFLSDVVEGMARDLASWGHTLPVGADRLTVATLFVNLQRRRIEPRPRTLHTARDLICPPSLQAGYELVKTKLTQGLDVNAHLSRSIKTNASYDDMLLNDWGFHHLHLGTSVRPSGLIQRTGDLLFIHLAPDDVYLVGIGDHHDWAAKRLNNALFDNWPTLFAGRMLPIRVDEIPQADHEALRNAGVFVMTNLPNGQVALPLGGGYATSKRSLDVTMRVGHICRETSELERRFETMIPKIVAALAPHGIKPEHLSFHLRQADDGAFFAVDDVSNVSVKLFEPSKAA